MNFQYLLSLAILILSINLSIQNEHSTVCKLLNGTLASCPIKDASCCPTGDFCCPKSIFYF